MGDSLYCLLKKSKKSDSYCRLLWTSNTDNSSTTKNLRAVITPRERYSLYAWPRVRGDGLKLKFVKFGMHWTKNNFTAKYQVSVQPSRLVRSRRFKRSAWLYETILSLVVTCWTCIGHYQWSQYPVIRSYEHDDLYVNLVPQERHHLWDDCTGTLRQRPATPLSNPSLQQLIGATEVIVHRSWNCQSFTSLLECFFLSDCWELCMIMAMLSCQFTLFVSEGFMNDDDITYSIWSACFRRRMHISYCGWLLLM